MYLVASPYLTIKTETYIVHPIDEQLPQVRNMAIAHHGSATYVWKIPSISLACKSVSSLKGTSVDVQARKFLIHVHLKKMWPREKHYKGWYVRIRSEVNVGHKVVSQVLRRCTKTTRQVVQTPTRRLYTRVKAEKRPLYL
jgi:hypothetical protein